MPDGWTPDTRQRLKRATRFYASLQAFTLECPKCGHVYIVRARTSDLIWDPQTGRFTCARCRRAYVLGIVAWPIAPGKMANATPRDQVPNVRQLAQLRAEGGGWWLADEAKIRREKPDETNLTLETDRDTEEDADDDDTDEHEE